MGRRRRTKVQRIINLIRKLIAFLFSHVGLCALVIGYAMLGAVVFRAIELPKELFVQRVVTSGRGDQIEEMWKVAYKKNELYRGIFKETLLNCSYTFRKVLMKAVQEGYDGKDNPEHPQWTMSGAFLYSLTVITTIGYGHIAPRSVFGRAITIIYAIIGIPLMLLFLTNVGDILAKTFRFLYSKTPKISLRNLLCEGMSKKQSSSTLKHNPSFASSSRSRQSAGKTSSQSQGGPKASRNHSGLHGIDSLNRGGGSSRPLHPDPSLESFEGAGAEIITMGDIRMEAAYGYDDPDQVEDEPGSLRGSTRDEREEIRYEQVAVPIHIILLVMALYFAVGAALFKFWEGSGPEAWTYLDGVYFCYISLTTIGFGDLMPGNSIKGDDAQAQEKLVICSLYLLFGMALIAMCFNLAQEEVVNKVTRIARKLGMIKHDDDEYA